MNEMNMFGKTELTYSTIKKTLKYELESELNRVFTEEYTEKFLDKLMKCPSDINEIRKIFTERKTAVGTDKLYKMVILNDTILNRISEIIYKFEFQIHSITRPITHYELFKFYTNDTYKVIETNYNIKLLFEILKIVDPRFTNMIFKLSEKVIASEDFTSCKIQQTMYAATLKEIDFKRIDGKVAVLTMGYLENYRHDANGNVNMELNRNLTTEQELEEIKQAYLAYKPALQEGYCFYRWLTGSVVKDDLEVR